MTYPPDFCALLQRIVNAIYAELDDVPDLRENLVSAYRAAFAALAEPQQGTPSGEDLHAAYEKGYMDAPTLVETECHYAGLRAVLTRYGAQAVPVAVDSDVIRALVKAEAALADIGDADREPGDDLAWCERRAAEALPVVREALALCTSLPLPEAQP